MATEQEARELEAAMAQYPELAAEVEACRQDIERYVRLQAIAPPPAIKDHLLRIVSDEDAEEALNDGQPGPAGSGAVQLSQRSSVWKWVTAASILLLLGSLLLAYTFYHRYHDYKDRYDSLVTAQQRLSLENQGYRTRMEEMQQPMNLLKDPAMKMVKLPGTPLSPAAMATVYWSPRSNEAYLLVNSLPTPAPGKQYQLWAIVDGKPVDMGMLDTGSKLQTFQKMKTVANAQQFAITLEKQGGSPTPTMDQLYVAGKI
jgi:anti-sigma-K factor RskA